MTGRILIVDDDRDMCELVERDLRLRGCFASWRTSAEDALEAIQHDDFDVVLTDLRMPGVDGFTLCAGIHEIVPDLPVIVLTAFGSLDTAVSAIRAGAYDFVTKPVELDELFLAVDRAVAHRTLQKRVHLLTTSLEKSHRSGAIHGESPLILDVVDQVDRIAGSDISVLITGESGTGKELVAAALHEQSDRREGPFVAINCSALPDSLIESELFGYVEGAFTGASKSRDGLFVEANGGTLFLDEIGDLPLSLQPKLLRALEERRIRPLGGGRQRSFDVRVVTATNQDLESAVDEGRFRRDLYYRINVVELAMPPLRARGTDVLILAQHFLNDMAAQFGKPVMRMAEGTASALLAYDWPGNVRELRNVIERAVVLARHDMVTVNDLPSKIRASRENASVERSTGADELVSMGVVEQRHIRRVLQAVGGNRTLAARILGFDRKTLYRKLRRGGLGGANAGVGSGGDR